MKALPRYSFALGFLFVLVASVGQLTAQTTAFTYQGRLNDGSGPATGSYDLSFALYDAASGGAQQGITLINTAVAVNNGLFTVMLNFGNQFPGADRWLEIGVRTNGGSSFSTLAPRQSLTPAPYAIYSGNAGAAASVPAAGIGAGTANINISGNAATAVTAAVAGSAVQANTATSATTAASATNANTAQFAVTAGTATNVVGLLPDAQLSTNIARLNGTNYFTGTNNFSNVVIATNPANQIAGIFTGNGAGITNVTSISIAPGSITSTMLAAGSVTSNQLATGAVNLQNLSTLPTSVSLGVIGNPTPINSENYGVAVAAFGADRFIVGDDFDKFTGVPTGIAYLFKRDGTLLATFHDPALLTGDRFGHAVAAVGTDKVLIGASGYDAGPFSAGAAFLFNTNGTLLLTITNPTPANNDNFGFAVAAVGPDRVLISAYNDFSAPNGGGSAYLYNTNGTLITTFNNHPVGGGESFGYSVAAIGTDKVIIGAQGDSTGATFTGAAFIYSTNGTLLTTITNPAPAPSDNFGYSVAAVGTDKVVIGAPANDGPVTDSGAAYLFTTNGILLATYTNAASPTGIRFGESVAAFGADKVIIGATGDNVGGSFAGAAFLFDTAGNLLTSFRKATPVAGDDLGLAVASLGSDKVLVTATGDDLIGTDTGAVYLFGVGASMPGLVSSAVADGVIMDTQISSNAAIADTKLATISTPGKVADSALSANVALRAGGNSFAGNQFILGALDVNGSFRAGNGATVFNNLQGGVAQMAGGSSTVKTNFTFAFPKAYGSVPNIIISARSGNVVPVDDTFAVSVRDVTTTNCTVNVVRVDNPSGWSQQVKVSWLAWE